MEEFIGAISQVGFPIAISVYLLIRFEQKMEKLTQVIAELNNKIDVLSERNK